MSSTKQRLDPLGALEERIAHADFPVEGLLVIYMNDHLRPYVEMVEELRAAAWETVDYRNGGRTPIPDSESSYVTNLALRRLQDALEGKDQNRRER